MIPFRLSISLTSFCNCSFSTCSLARLVSNSNTIFRGFTVCGITSSPFGGQKIIHIVLLTCSALQSVLKFQVCELHILETTLCIPRRPLCFPSRFRRSALSGGGSETLGTTRRRPSSRCSTIHCCPDSGTHTFRHSSRSNTTLRYCDGSR
jgi:hypothetical protein